MNREFCAAMWKIEDAIHWDAFKWIVIKLNCEVREDSHSWSPVLESPTKNIHLEYCTRFVGPYSAALEVSKRTHWGSRTQAWEVSALARPSESEGRLGCSCEHQRWPRSWWTTQTLIGMITWFRGVDYVYLAFIFLLRQLKWIWPWKGERHLG